MAKDDGEFYVSEKVLAEYLGVTDRRVRQLFKDGVAVKVKRGTYDLKKSVFAYIEFIKKEDSLKKKDIDAIKLEREAEGLLHDQLKKRKTELIVGRLESKLVFATDVEKIWSALAFNIKTKLSALPVKLAPIVYNAQNQREVRQILKREIDIVLTDLADFDIEKIRKDDDIDDD